MKRVTEILEIPSYDTKIRVVDHMALLVAENGNGKTALLNEIAHGTYKYSSQIDAVYHIGFEKNCSSAKELLIKARIRTEDELFNYIKPYTPEPVLRMLESRIQYEKLTSGVVDDGFAWRRMVLIALLRAWKHERYMLLIDEPELMTHPLMRAEMAAMLKQIRSEGNPVIIATNLDNIVEDLVSSPEQIVRLETVDQKVRINQINLDSLEQKVKDFYHSDVMLMRRFSGEKQTYNGLKNVVEQNYANYIASTLKKDLFDISFARNIVMGEGASEGVLFDYAKDGLYPEWIRKHRVTFISCLGKATMPLFFLFFNELGIPVVCMTDYDNSTNRVHNAYRNAFNRYEKEHPSLFRHMELNPDLEGHLKIDPPYKLEPIEKPVNVYVNTYATGKATNDVLGLMRDWFMMIEEMEKANEHN